MSTCLVCLSPHDIWQSNRITQEPIIPLPDHAPHHPLPLPGGVTSRKIPEESSPASTKGYTLFQGKSLQPPPGLGRFAADGDVYVSEAVMADVTSSTRTISQYREADSEWQTLKATLAFGIGATKFQHPTDTKFSLRFWPKDPLPIYCLASLYNVFLKRARGKSAYCLLIDLPDGIVKNASKSSNPNSAAHSMKRIEVLEELEDNIDIDIDNVGDEQDDIALVKVKPTTSNIIQILAVQSYEPALPAIQVQGTQLPAQAKLQTAMLGPPTTFQLSSDPSCLPQRGGMDVDNAHKKYLMNQHISTAKQIVTGSDPQTDDKFLSIDFSYDQDLPGRVAQCIASNYVVVIRSAFDEPQISWGSPLMYHTIKWPGTLVHPTSRLLEQVSKQDDNKAGLQFRQFVDNANQSPVPYELLNQPCAHGRTSHYATSLMDHLSFANVSHHGIERRGFHGINGDATLDLNYFNLTYAGALTHWEHEPEGFGTIMKIHCGEQWIQYARFWSHDSDGQISDAESVMPPGLMRCTYTADKSISFCQRFYSWGSLHLTEVSRLFDTTHVECVNGHHHHALSLLARMAIALGVRHDIQEALQRMVHNPDDYATQQSNDDDDDDETAMQQVQLDVVFADAVMSLFSRRLSWDQDSRPANWDMPGEGTKLFSLNLPAIQANLEACHRLASQNDKTLKNLNSVQLGELHASLFGEDGNEDHLLSIIHYVLLLRTFADMPLRGKRKRDDYITSRANKKRTNDVD
ncbi:hypothetical protein AURDEDRAFT_120638 [Auricularia subglabra TFB-10046 SS5]|nr:hypothetical protein AURDEDRAFT_120638 [Auricularia subglabra TFB-10046 SS5]